MLERLITYLLLLIQGGYAFLRTPRLGTPPGDSAGTLAGDQPTLRLLALGESTVAGVGVDAPSEALTAQTARALNAATGCAVAWQAVGQMGATVRLAREELLPRIPAGAQADVCLIVLGVNDTLRLRAPSRWARDMSALVDEVRVRVDPSLIVLTAVPPVGHLTALSQPLRRQLGRHAARLDEALQSVAHEQGDIIHASMPFDGGADFLAADGFHPSTLGYRAWGERLAAYIAKEDLDAELRGSTRISDGE